MKGRAHTLFPERTAIAGPEQVSDPDCWQPSIVGQVLVSRLGIVRRQDPAPCHYLNAKQGAEANHSQP